MKNQKHFHFKNRFQWPISFLISLAGPSPFRHSSSFMYQSPNQIQMHFFNQPAHICKWSPLASLYCVSFKKQSGLKHSLWAHCEMAWLGCVSWIKGYMWAFMTSQVQNRPFLNYKGIKSLMILMYCNKLPISKRRKF